MTSDPASITTAEFERRRAQAERYAYRPMFLVLIPALAGLLMLMAETMMGEHRVPPWVGSTGMVLLIGFGIAGTVVGMVREGRAPRVAGLLCGACGGGLVGGKNGATTHHVRKTGCCRVCAGPVLRDHPGVQQAAAAAGARAAGRAHASAMDRDDFAARLAAFHRVQRRQLLAVLVAGLAAPVALAVTTLLPLDREAALAVSGLALLATPVLLGWALLTRGALARRLGLECPACRENPVEGTDRSILRTGMCPHCTAVILQPTR